MSSIKKDLSIGNLLAIYGNAIDQKARAILECYYNCDLSLAEISESFGITRQGVRSFVVRYSDTLKGLENALRLNERVDKINGIINATFELAKDSPQILEQLQQIKNLLEF